MGWGTAGHAASQEARCRCRGVAAGWPPALQPTAQVAPSSQWKSIQV